MKLCVLEYFLAVAREQSIIHAAESLHISQPTIIDKIINTSGNSNLCFRPLSPKREEGMNIIWKKYQVFSKASEKFIMKIRELFAGSITKHMDSFQKSSTKKI